MDKLDDAGDAFAGSLPTARIAGAAGLLLGRLPGFYVAFDLVFGIKNFQEKHLSVVDVAEHYVVTLPELLVQQVIPVSLLLALLYVLTNLSRYHELTAMRAAGVSLWRLFLPLSGCGEFFWDWWCWRV